MQKTRIELKDKFKKGDKPTEIDYSNLMDSYVHKLDDSFVESLPDATISTRGISAQASSAEAEAGTNNSKFTTPMGVKKAIEKFAPVTTVNGKIGNVTIAEYTPEDSNWREPSFINEDDILIERNGDIQFRKIENVVYLVGEFELNSPSEFDDTFIFELEEQFTPEFDIPFYIPGLNGTTARILIKESGQVVCTNNINTKISISGLSYPIN